MKTMRVVHVICGQVGAGKTTFARKLAADKNAVRFAVDEWMHGLFGADQPPHMSLAWATERVQRCEMRILSTCQQILASGRDVVLELGLMRVQDRDRVQAWADAGAYTSAFYWIDVDRETRRQRVLDRNADKGVTFAFDVTQSMFDVVDKVFEPPAAHELARSRTISGGAIHG